MPANEDKPKLTNVSSDQNVESTLPGEKSSELLKIFGVVLLVIAFFVSVYIMSQAGEGNDSLNSVLGINPTVVGIALLFETIIICIVFFVFASIAQNLLSIRIMLSAKYNLGQLIQFILQQKHELHQESIATIEKISHKIDDLKVELSQLRNSLTSMQSNSLNVAQSEKTFQENVISVTCPQCQYLYRIQSQFLNKKVKCKKCDCEFVIKQEGTV